MGSFLLNASVAGVRFALFELVVLFCVGFFFFALSLIRVYFFFFRVCVYVVRPPLCVSVPRSAAGLQQQAAGAGGRRTSPAHPERFLLRRFVWNAECGVTHTHVNKSCAGS